MASAIFECINSNNNEPNKKKKLYTQEYGAIKGHW